MKYVKVFYSKKWVENTRNDRVITLKSHQILLTYYSVVWKIIQEKMPKFEKKKKKKNDPNSQNEQIQINLFFSLQISYRYKATKVFYGNPIDLIFGSKSVIWTLLCIPPQHTGQLMTVNPSKTSVCTEWQYEIWFWYFTLKHKHKKYPFDVDLLEISFCSYDAVVLLKLILLKVRTHQIHYILSDDGRTEDERSEFLWPRILFI